MWELILERINRAVSGTVFMLYGGVSYFLDYKDKTVCLKVYNKPMSCFNRKIIRRVEFGYDIYANGELKSICDIVQLIEEFLYKISKK